MYLNILTYLAYMFICKPYKHRNIKRSNIPLSLSEQLGDIYFEWTFWIGFKFTSKCFSIFIINPATTSHCSQALWVVGMSKNTSVCPFSLCKCSMTHIIGKTYEYSPFNPSNHIRITSKNDYVIARTLVLYEFSTDKKI